MNFDQHLQQRWYGKPGWLYLLWPLEFVFRFFAALRRVLYRIKILSSWRAPVPVIVIGNISVGGTGKTPVTIAVCELLQRAGFKPGIVSRGYGANPPHLPYAIDTAASASITGDEPLLIARRTRCPVVIAPKRIAAAQYLLKQQVLRERECNVLICDDGLQHYALQRDIEIAVIDHARGFGNGHCLPVGPLREPITRLNNVDAILRNGGDDETGFQINADAFVQIESGQSIPPRTWCKQHSRVHAVAGIGNPQRFFSTLRTLGCEVIEHAFPDHHVFTANDLQFGDDLPIAMTEKDAVKCTSFATPQCWYLQVRAVLPESLGSTIISKLSAWHSNTSS